MRNTKRNKKRKRARSTVKNWMRKTKRKQTKNHQFYPFLILGKLLRNSMKKTRISRSQVKSLTTSTMTGFLMRQKQKSLLLLTGAPAGILHDENTLFKFAAKI